MRCRRFGLSAYEWGVLFACAFIAGSIGCMGMTRNPQGDRKVTSQRLQRQLINDHGDR